MGDSTIGQGMIPISLTKPGSLRRRDLLLPQGTEPIGVNKAIGWTDREHRL